MVRYNPKSWLSLIFHTYSRHVLKLLLPALVTIGIYTTLIAFVFHFFEVEFKGTTAVHSLLGIVLGLFLVFRTNSAYDRWWEGRKHWGSLVNNTRNLASKLNAFLPQNHVETRFYFAQMIPNFVTALRDHLREGTEVGELDIVDPYTHESLSKYEHVPNMLTTIIYRRINILYKEGIITGHQFFLLDKEVKSFSDIMGACERIKNTPIPYSYSMYIKKFIFTYTITLPFGFVYEFHYITVPIVLFIFFILLSIELIAEEIEDPFGKDINDLPTDNLTVKIKKNVQELLLSELDKESPQPKKVIEDSSE